MVTLGIVAGSIRPGRMGAQVARWVQDRAEARPGLRVELVTPEYNNSYPAALAMIPAGAAQLPLRHRLDLAGVLRLVPADDDALDGLVEDLLELTTLLPDRLVAAS